ncbi:MAG: hypothetical protein ABIH58_01285 [Patescibacteria group bacterium]
MDRSFVELWDAEGVRISLGWEGKEGKESWEGSEGQESKESKEGFGWFW